MVAFNTEWKVLPHGRLVRLSPDLMTVEGDIRTPVGPMPRRMTVARAPDRRLVIYSAISLDAAGMAELDAFGTPAVLVVPGYRHRLDVAAWKTRFPDALVLTPEAARDSVEKAVAVDVSDFPYREGTVVVTEAAGTGRREAVMEIRDEGGLSVVLNDLIFKLPPRGGLTGWLQKLTGFASPAPSIPSMIRRSWVAEPRALADQMSAWAADPSLARIVISHGGVIDQNPASVLQDIAATLRKR